MKISSYITITLCLFTLPGFITLKGELSEEDRQYAIDYLKETEAELLNIIKNLSDTQLEFKIAEDSWSISQCLEHIAISEDFVFELSQNALKNSAEAGTLDQSDETVIRLVTDRSQKSKTLDVLKPSNQFGSSKQALETFVKRREEHIKYLRKTNDPLRSSYFDFPFGKGDAYQVILFLGAHSKRHILQIREIMAHEDFPK